MHPTPSRAINSQPRTLAQCETDAIGVCIGLRDHLKTCNAVESLVVLPLIGDIECVRQSISALIVAKRTDGATS